MWYRVITRLIAGRKDNAWKRMKIEGKENRQTESENSVHAVVSGVDVLQRKK